jgi:hypothetical protein
MDITFLTAMVDSNPVILVRQFLDLLKADFIFTANFINNVQTIIVKRMDLNDSNRVKYNDIYINFIYFTVRH